MDSGRGLFLLVASVAAFAIITCLHVAHMPDGRTIIRIIKAPQLRPNLSNAKADVFQQVNAHFSHFYLFNAYHDYRSDRPLVRVLAVGNKRVHLPLFCHLLFDDPSNQLVTVAMDSHREVFLPFEQHAINDGFFLRCSFFTNGHPVAVSISTSPVHLGSNLIRVRHIPRPPPVTGNIHRGIISCVAPMFNIKDAISLAEWLEVNRLFGVGHFVMYNFSISSSVDRLLRYYMALGVVTVVPWSHHPIPVMTYGTWPPDDTRIHYYGQFITFNDCLYRTMNHAPFVQFIDLDELLVPYRDANLTACLQRLYRRHNPTAFYFQTTSFKLPNKASTSTATPKWTPRLHQTWRERYITVSSSKYKVATVTDHVTIMGVHSYFFPLTPGVLRVSPDDALLHHYKNNDFLPVDYQTSCVQVTRLLGLVDTVQRRVRHAVTVSKS